VRVMYGGIFNYHFVGNLLLSLWVKEFLKSDLAKSEALVQWHFFLYTSCTNILVCYKCGCLFIKNVDSYP